MIKNVPLIINIVVELLINYKTKIMGNDYEKNLEFQSINLGSHFPCVHISKCNFFLGLLPPVMINCPKFDTFLIICLFVVLMFEF